MGHQHHLLSWGGADIVEFDYVTAWVEWQRPVGVAWPDLAAGSTVSPCDRAEAGDSSSQTYLKF